LQALVQRVSSAEIIVAGDSYSKIDVGLVAFVCFEIGDKSDVVNKFINKICNFRFFKDDRGILSTCLKEISAELMIVSQFTLAAITHKGNKPSFHNVAPSSEALLLYDKLLTRLQESQVSFKSGIFGKDMDIKLVNSGPVTFSFKF